MKNVFFLDTTLRDGEQAPGVAFTVKEKIEMAKMLDALGIDQIEAGTPVMGPPEDEAVREIAGLGLRTVVSAWNRVNIGDIKASLDCGVKFVHVSAPVSDLHIGAKLGKDRSWVIDSMRRAVCYAVEHGCRVTVGAEDASRADIGFLICYAAHARSEGAERLRIADTVGVLEPFKTKDLIKCIVDHTGIEIEFHGHNDFGMATANTYAAFKAGASFLNTTIGGLGERAGNCSFEEIAGVLKQHEGIDLDLDYGLLSDTLNYMNAAAGRLTPPFAPVCPARSGRWHDSCI